MQQNTIANNTFTSSVKDISQSNIEYGITPHQFYCLLGCVTIVAIILIISITKVIQTLILRMNYITPLLIEKLKNEVLKELDK